jgi:hypothetical protein
LAVFFILVSASLQIKVQVGLQVNNCKCKFENNSKVQEANCKLKNQIFWSDYKLRRFYEKVTRSPHTVKWLDETVKWPY